VIHQRLNPEFFKDFPVSACASVSIGQNQQLSSQIPRILPATPTNTVIALEELVSQIFRNEPGARYANESFRIIGQWIEGSSTTPQSQNQRKHRPRRKLPGLHPTLLRNKPHQRAKNGNATE
jgi:hypothetical protein